MAGRAGQDQDPTEVMDALLGRTDGKQYLVFRMGAEEYGIGIPWIQEIRRWEEPNPMPATPEYVRGILNLRGGAVPVMDLRIKLESGEAVYSDRTVLLVVHSPGGEDAALAVDAVSEVLAIPGEAVRPVSRLSESRDSRFLEGVAVLEERMVLLVDMDELLEGQEDGMMTGFRQAVEEAPAAGMNGEEAGNG